MSELSRRKFAKLAAAGVPLSLVAARAVAQAAQSEPGHTRLNSDRAYQGGDLGTSPAGFGGFGAATPPHSNSPWAKQMGLEIYTVRDVAATDLAGTLAKVAAIGYKEVEPIDYGGLTAQQYRALLDRNGLVAISTHGSCPVGSNFDKILDDLHTVGIKYFWVQAARAGAPPMDPFGPRPAGGRGGFMGGRRGPGRGPGRGARGRGPGGFPGFRAATADSTKKTVDLYNKAGAIAFKRYGMKVLVHNHAIEFQRFAGTDQCPYDIIVGESDPQTVVMQMDIGWACVAGENPIEWFNRHPGRFELWHVKDVMNLQYLFPQPEMTEQQRMQVAGRWITPVGLGGINYAEIFRHAKTAGMRHFCIEQDNAASWGDSIAASKVGYDNLLRDFGA